VGFGVWLTAWIPAQFVVQLLDFGVGRERNLPPLADVQFTALRRASLVR